MRGQVGNKEHFWQGEVCGNKRHLAIRSSSQHTSTRKHDWTKGSMRSDEWEIHIDKPPMLDYQVCMDYWSQLITIHHGSTINDNFLSNVGFDQLDQSKRSICNINVPLFLDLVPLFAPFKQWQTVTRSDRWPDVTGCSPTHVANGPSMTQWCFRMGWTSLRVRIFCLMNMLDTVFVDVDQLELVMANGWKPNILGGW